MKFEKILKVINNEGEEILLKEDDVITIVVSDDLASDLGLAEDRVLLERKIRFIKEGYFIFEDVSVDFDEIEYIEKTEFNS